MSFFSKKKNKKMTRLFFATDIHGSERTYRKFINAGKFYDVNVIVMGGDIQGKLLNSRSSRKQMDIIARPCRELSIKLPVRLNYNNCRRG